MSDHQEFSVATTEWMKQRARAVGFDRVGIAAAGDADPDGHLERWLAAGRHGSMAYLARDPAVRRDVRRLVPGARSVVALALGYHHPAPADPGGATGRVAAYAWGRDYHRVIGGRLRRLRRMVQERFPAARLYTSVDTAPVLERAWAQRAGLGWIGKNGAVIVPGLGSWVFLATLITDLPLLPDRPHPDRCGRCTRCLAACTAGALEAPRLLDARRCLSYLTIEHRGHLPPDYDPGRWVFGCDRCQDVCPWNRAVARSTVEDFAPRPGRPFPDLHWLADLTEDDFEAWCTGSALRRAGREGLRRNAGAVLGKRAKGR